MGSAIFDVASRADVPGVIALIGRVFAEYGFVYDPTTEVPDLLDFERHYEPPQGGFFVLRQGEVIAGSVGIARIDAATAELHRLYLDAALRGRGTGRALVETALDWCRTREVSHLVLWSDTRFEQATGSTTAWDSAGRDTGRCPGTSTTAANTDSSARCRSRRREP
jgi:GNAT superfamily N-acetyltransferase